MADTGNTMAVSRNGGNMTPTIGLSIAVVAGIAIALVLIMRIRRTRRLRFGSRCVDELIGSMDEAGITLESDYGKSLWWVPLASEFEGIKRSGKPYRIRWHSDESGFLSDGSQWHRVGWNPNPEYSSMCSQFDKATSSIKEECRVSHEPDWTSRYQAALEAWPSAVEHYDTESVAWDTEHQGETCSTCDGTGVEVVNHGASSYVDFEECHACGGSGDTGPSDPDPYPYAKPARPEPSDFVDYSSAIPLIRDRIENSELDLPDLPWPLVIDRSGSVVIPEKFYVYVSFDAA